MKFSPEALLSQLALPAATRRIVVAFSGGLDSSVLLHALAQVREQLPAPLHALHVDHSLQVASVGWAEQCRKVASSLDIDFSLLRILVDPAPGASVEAAARDGRYAALADFLEEGDVLFTAQHADDQAETFLLQALRGAGVAGLAAMPVQRTLGRGIHLRPLLPWTRRELETWAGEQGIEWIDDPSNAETRFDRNYLRNEILPSLRERWPGLARTLSRSATHCADARELLDEEAERLLDDAGATSTTLSMSFLRELGDARRRLLLRHWLQSAGAAAASDAQLAEMLDLLESRDDATAEIRWDGHVLRCHRGDFHLEAPAGRAPRAGTWDTSAAFDLGGGHGILHREAADIGIDPAIGTVELRYREGGERLRPLGDDHGRELKKLLQQRGVPRWRRDRLPLLYHRGRLVAVADLWIDQSVAAEGGWRVRWERPMAANNEERQQ